jgi:hypothetical protein
MAPELQTETVIWQEGHRPEGVGPRGGGFEEIS